MKEDVKLLDFDKKILRYKYLYLLIVILFGSLVLIGIVSHIHLDRHGVEQDEQQEKVGSLLFFLGIFITAWASARLRHIKSIKYYQRLLEEKRSHEDL